VVNLTDVQLPCADDEVLSSGNAAEAGYLVLIAVDDERLSWWHTL